MITPRPAPRHGTSQPLLPLRPGLGLYAWLVMRRAAVTLACALTCAAAACGGSGSTAPSAFGSGGPARANDGVCSGVHNCRVVARTDIDGDGKPDEVAVVGRPRHDQSTLFWPDNARPLLRVRTATGLLRYTVILRGPVFDRLIRGEADIDGVPGDELLVGYGDGAHGQPETVVTFHNGALVALAAPKPFFGSKKPIGSWGRDGSISSNLGWSCLPGARVEAYTATSTIRHGHFDGYRLWHRTWRWSGSHWQPTTPPVTHKLKPPKRLPARYLGWTGCGNFA